MFFRKTIIPEFDFSLIAVEMHNHILPCLDDGSKSVEESLEILKTLEKAGYRKIIVTPHVLTDLYPNTPASIKDAYTALRQAADLEAEPHTVQIEIGAEYMVDEVLLDRFVNEPPLLMAGKYILIEFPLYQAPRNYKEVIFELSLKGYQPIIAHPERYLYAYRNMEFFQDLVQRGCLLQLNINSVLGGYGKMVNKLARQLIKLKVYDLLGSDIHNARQAHSLIETSVREELTKQLGDYPFKNKILLG
jgi:tyrosine-protein phosphatase YwqE